MRKLSFSIRFLPLGVVLCALLLLFGSRAAAAAPRQQSGDGTPSVAVGDSSLGQILVDAKGMSLYMFDKDEPDKSNCYEGCAVKWPPLLVNAGEQPVAGEGVTAKLGVTERTDGTYQVTANGWPLYYWFKDVNPGDVLGQAVGDVLAHVANGVQLGGEHVGGAILKQFARAPAHIVHRGTVWREQHNAG